MLYSPRHAKDCFLPTKSKGFATSRFTSDEINEIYHGKHCLWVEILKKSFLTLFQIKKDILWVFLTLNQKI